MTNSAIYIPEKIKVGYQNRQGTYTGKLAYVIYFDAKGKLRKEASWNSWRHVDVEANEFENTPTSGFVLNKKVGGYDTGWNHRQTYTRVYDPRGFEFEIVIPNLLYILENTSCIKGKGLEGEFVYGWEGTELVLIPTSSPDYTKLTQYSEDLKTCKVLAKELIQGATYKTNKNQEVVYLGRFVHWESRWIGRSGGYECINRGKKYFFKHNSSLDIKSGLGHLLKCIDAKPVPGYADLMDQLEHCDEIYPLDKSKDEFIDFSWEEYEGKPWKLFIDFEAVRLSVSVRGSWSSETHNYQNEPYHVDFEDLNRDHYARHSAQVKKLNEIAENKYYVEKSNYYYRDSDRISTHTDFTKQEFQEFANKIGIKIRKRYLTNGKSAHITYFRFGEQ